jgi:hypothetical protein
MMKLCGWSCVLKKTSIYIGPPVDDQGRALSYTVTGQPDGIDVVYVEVAADGREPGAYLQGYIAYSNVASNAPPVDFHVIITVTKEGDGNSFQSDSFTWTIRDTSRLGSISDQVSREGEFIFWIPPVARMDGETLVIHYSGLPLGLEYFENSGLVYGYVSYANIASNGHARSLEVTIFVNDGKGAESKTFHWQVEDTNRIPVLPDVSISEGDYINVKINAEDATGASLTYAADNLPRGLRIDSATGRITGTVSYRNVGPIEGVREFLINIRVTDGESEDVRTVTWTVQDKDWWSAPPNLTNSEGEEVYIELPGENVSGQPVEYRFANLPQGIVWDAQNGALRGRVAYRNASPAQPEVGYQVEVETIPDAELRTFTWTILDNPRILLEEGLVVETWVGEEIDAVVPTAARDDADWIFEAENLPPQLSIDAATGRIAGTIVDPATAPQWPPADHDYSELGYMEYHVVLRVRDTASVDERHLIWRVFVPPNNLVSNNSIWDWRSEINQILSRVGGYIRHRNNDTAVPQTELEFVRLNALALVDRFHNTHITEGALKLFKDLQQEATDRLKQLILQSKGMEIIRRIVETKERIDQATDIVKRLWQLWLEKDVKLYCQTFENEQGSYVTVVLAYRPGDGYVNVGYFGKVKFIDLNTQQLCEKQFGFYVIGKVKKVAGKWLWARYEVEDMQLNWLVPR